MDQPGSPKTATLALAPIFKPTDDPEDPKGYPRSSVTKTIYCQVSGVILGRLEVCIFEGHLAYLQTHSDATYMHPFYQLSNVVLCNKLEDALRLAQDNGWIVTWREQQRLQLLVSAIMHQLDCISQQGACLPSYQIAVGSAARLLSLARWYFFISSQRLAFPNYKVSKDNDNLQWENYRHWVDAALKIRENWSKKKKEIEIEAKKKANDEAIREIKSESVFRRVDIRKVWAWMEIQLVLHYNQRQIEYFKELFLNGDVDSHEYILDDVDDLREALLKHCDIGNEIMFFIRKRLSGIAALISDFRSSFTLISGPKGRFQEEQQTPQEVAFFSDFDKQAEQLEVMPPKPTREAFATLAHFMQAEAKWNILNKRWKKLQDEKANPKPILPKASNDPDDSEPEPSIEDL